MLEGRRHSSLEGKISEHRARAEETGRRTLAKKRIRRVVLLTALTDRTLHGIGRYAGPDRRAALGRLNAEVEWISRVIVHPTYRGCGLAVRLVRHALATAPVPVVEALAAMGKIHPFFARAGMQPVGLFRGQSQYYHYYIAIRS